MHPVSDLHDTWVQLTNNHVLFALFFLHIVALVGLDLSALYISKHSNSIARVLVDSFKLIVMWLLGKLFWEMAILPMLAEPWKPVDWRSGSLWGSWVMPPVAIIILYGTMVFKKSMLVPLVWQDGKLQMRDNTLKGAKVRRIGMVHMLCRHCCEWGEGIRRDVVDTVDVESQGQVRLKQKMVDLFPCGRSCPQPSTIPPVLVMRNYLCDENESGPALDKNP